MDLNSLGIALCLLLYIANLVILVRFVIVDSSLWLAVVFAALFLLGFCAQSLLGLAQILSEPVFITVSLAVAVVGLIAQVSMKHAYKESGCSLFVFDLVGVASFGAFVAHLIAVARV